MLCNFDDADLPKRLFPETWPALSQNWTMQKSGIAKRQYKEVLVPLFIRLAVRFKLKFMACPRRKLGSRSGFQIRHPKETNEIVVKYSFLKVARTRGFFVEQKSIDVN